MIDIYFTNLIFNYIKFIILRISNKKTKSMVETTTAEEETKVDRSTNAGGTTTTNAPANATLTSD